MDWTHKHFNREAVFAAPADRVRDAARAVMGQALGWQIRDTAGGFAARGHSAGRAATASFRIEPAEGGTTVAIALAVERAGALGFMLFDAGHYYDRQIRKWLDAIRDRLAGKPAVPLAPSRGSRVLGTLFTAAVVIVCVALGLNLIVFPVIGLITGDLYLLGRGGSSGLAAQGTWARVLSVVLLALGLFVLFGVWKARKPSRPRILFPPEGRS